MNKLSPARLATIAALVLVPLIGVYWFQQQQFRVTEIVPKNGTIPTSSQNVILRFNRDIADSVNSEDIQIEPNIKQDVLIEDNEINIRLASTVQEGETLTITASLQSTENETLEISESLVSQYVEPANQDPELRQIVLEQSDSFESDYPLINYLPFVTDDFEIDYRFPDSGEDVMPIIITSKTREIPRPSESTSNTSPLYQEYIRRLRNYRSQAIEYLEDSGFYDEQRYQLVFPEPYLLDEFNGEYER